MKREKKATIDRPRKEKESEVTKAINDIGALLYTYFVNHPDARFHAVSAIGYATETMIAMGSANRSDFDELSKSYRDFLAKIQDSVWQNHITPTKPSAEA
ncbi:MAG: hypothetical protein IJS19_02980 [Muribaculaceae bacterium]|nr:hypothetical protein [Muribaculaceae bacterium]